MTALKLALGTATVFFAIGGVAFAYNHVPRTIPAPVQPSQAPLNAAVIGMQAAVQAATSHPAAAPTPKKPAPTDTPATTTPAIIYVPAPATTTPPTRRTATTTATSSQSARPSDQSSFQLADNSWMTFFKHHRDK